MKILKLLSLVGILSLVACGGGDDGGSDPAPVEERVPQSVSLVFPNNNEECNTGIQINDVQSTVNFAWDAATNATSYRLIVVNLLDGSQVARTVTATNSDVDINMNTPYRWYVISQSNSSSTTAKSQEWKFYNSGPAVTTYAPFPAEVVQPAMGVNINATSVDLQWTTSDVDGDLASFEVYFGTVSPPTDMIGSGTDSFLNNVAVSSNTYYWMVKSIDAEGNSSNSQVFEFRISN